MSQYRGYGQGPPHGGEYAPNEYPTSPPTDPRIAVCPPRPNYGPPPYDQHHQRQPPYGPPHQTPGQWYPPGPNTGNQNWDPSRPYNDDRGRWCPTHQTHGGGCCPSGPGFRPGPNNWDTRPGENQYFGPTHLGHGG